MNKTIIVILLIGLIFCSDLSLGKISTKNWKPTIRNGIFDNSSSDSNSNSNSNNNSNSNSKSNSNGSNGSGNECQYPGYTLGNVVTTNNGFSTTLSLISAGPYGNDATDLNLDIILQSEQIIRFKLYNPSDENPWNVIPGIIKSPEPTSKPAMVDYNIEFNQSPFGFSIIRVSTGETLFNTTIPLGCEFNGLVFSEHYLELSTSFSNTNPNLYGLGERTSQLRLLNNFTYTIFNKDQGTASVPNINLYGSHPFYLQLGENGLAHGVFLFNSNAMDVVIQPESLTYKVVGGNLDFYFFLGSSPLEVIQQYTSIIGTTHMPTYWSLGWHQCRWGYNTVQETQYVVSNYSYYNIPLETMWNDIDYMDAYKDFTLDPDRFTPSVMKQFIDYLHSNNQHYIMIVDPAISNTTDYESFTQLISSGAYIQTSADDNEPQIGKVWPGTTVFPDFLNPDGVQFWLEQFQSFYQMVEFDGAWIDMNEPSNFCNGDCGQSNSHMSGTGFDPNYPPYLPGGSPLSDKTINMTSLVYNGTMVYYTHNLYGYSEGIATRKALETILGTRSTIISRSSFVGAGYHYGHWLGDNESTYQDLYFSIPGILAMNMFGIPMVGADICGFNGNTTAELCGRWMQLGLFYPFSRNHNTHNGNPQEPYVFGQQVTDISIAAINGKYTLLPYYYTLFYLSHLQGDPVVRPLFFEYPNDPETYSLDTQFLVGSSLMVSPVLTEGVTSVEAYFPDDIWYDYFTGELIEPGTQNLSAPLDTINVHLRGGTILPVQPTNQYVKPIDGIPITLEVARTLPLNLIIALDNSSNANGLFYFDDGKTYNFQNGEYTLVQFSVLSTNSNGVVSKLYSVIDSQAYTDIDLTISTVTVYGVASEPSQVVVNGDLTNSFTFSSTNNLLQINQLTLSIYDQFEIDWS